ncbi:MAG: hypothetical protein ACLTE2_03430 [Eubacteriales bacterium]
MTDFPAVVTMLPLHLLRLIRCRLENHYGKKHLVPHAKADALEESSHSEIIEHTVSVHTLTQTEDKKMAEKPIKTPPRMKKPDGVYIADSASRNVRKLDF